MALLPIITFTKLAIATKGTVVVLAGSEDGLSSVGGQLDEEQGGAISRAMKAADFKAKFASTLEILAPGSGGLDRVVVVGVGDGAQLEDNGWARLGGAAIAKSGGGASPLTVLLERPDGKKIEPGQAASFAVGMKLRSYSYDRFKSTKDDDKKAKEKPRKVTISMDKHLAARRAWPSFDAVSDGTLLARDLVNEPANFLGPEEFAKRASELGALGVNVQILTERDMQKLNMNALLAVGQGSVRPSRLAVMHWEGGKARQQPIAFVGKGVVFDTGGISIKPAGGMEEMKGDMGGAAAVLGLMHAVATRKAKANVVGIIGLVENMPDGNATRPGDVITSADGQTIEVLNTDAEGRLVLADALWYARDHFDPEIVVDLATLTGACVVALGHHNAGLFCNNDDLAERLTAAGQVTGETVWRLPIGKEYDKLIDSKVADMKNTGGRYGGAITAAQFLYRFVGDTPWAHLDVAGTAFSSPKTEINQSWASGFGVRLLNQLIADHYET